MGCESKHWPSVKFSQGQCGTAAQVVHWAVLHPAPNQRAQRGVGIRKGVIQQRKKKSGGLDSLQPMVDKRQGQCAVLTSRGRTLHVGSRTLPLMHVRTVLVAKSTVAYDRHLQWHNTVGITMTQLNRECHVLLSSNLKTCQFGRVIPQVIHFLRGQLPQALLPSSTTKLSPICLTY